MESATKGGWIGIFYHHPSPSLHEFSPTLWTICPLTIAQWMLDNQLPCWNGFTFKYWSWDLSCMTLMLVAPIYTSELQAHLLGLSTPSHPHPYGAQYSLQLSLAITQYSPPDHWKFWSMVFFGSPQTLIKNCNLDARIKLRTLPSTLES